MLSLAYCRQGDYSHTRDAEVLVIEENPGELEPTTEYLPPWSAPPPPYDGNQVPLVPLAPVYLPP